jgi:hypothetical protein
MTSEAATYEGATNAREEITEADVEQYMTSLSNWGRWGEDDRLGGRLRGKGPSPHGARDLAA